jgi:hypothetical protein
MVNLSETWFVEGNIDFESKKYRLLAYLQAVTAQFNERKLYPHLADIVFHYNNLMKFKENKSFLQNQFPKRLTGIQIQKLEMIYEEMIADDELMTTLEEITYYAVNKMKKTLDLGAELYDFVEDRISITPVGILPLQNTEGYFFLSQNGYPYTRVYYYYLGMFEKHNEKYRSLKAQYVDEWERNIINTYESIKINLLRHRRDIATPAVYALETNLTLPLEETLLPIAKRSLVRYISR